jgi:hypothetical protein
MATAGHTPNLVASEALAPFSNVAITAPLTVSKATPGLHICGICDGSVNAWDGIHHAVAGGIVSLQNGEFMQGKAGDSIFAGQLLISDANAFFVASTSGGDEAQFQAAEAANAGEVFWVYRLGAITTPFT